MIETHYATPLSKNPKMKEKEFLFNLIKSMKGPEKRYFKTSCSKDTNYLELFDAMNKLKVFDEELLKKSLKNPKIVKNLSSEKNYLMEAIMSSLRDFNAKRYNEIQVHALLVDAKLLFDRKLFKISEKKLKKASKLAKQHGFWSILLGINQLERKLAKHHGKDLAESIDRLVDENDAMMKELDNFLYFRDLNDKLFCSTRGKFRARDEGHRQQIKDLFPAGGPEGLPAPLTFEAKKLYHFACMQYHLLMAEDKKGLLAYRKRLRLWEDHPERIHTDLKGYKSSLANYLNICHLVHAYGEFPSTLEKLKSYPATSREEQAEEFRNVTYLELLYCMNRALLIQAQSLIRNVIDEGLRKFKPPLIPHSQHMAYCHSVSMVYLVLEKFQEARTWLLRMEEEFEGHRTDLVRFQKLVLVLVDYELGMEEQMKADHFKRYLQSQSQSAERWLKNNGGVMEFDRMVLKTIGRLVGKEKEVRRKIFNDLSEELETLPQSEKNQLGTRLWELSVWVEARRDERSLEAVFRERINLNDEGQT